MRWTAMVVLFGLLLGTARCEAALVITEAMSSATNNGNDWWELTNTGPGAVDLSGYYWDDDGPMGNDGAIFGDVTITAGQSIIITEGPKADFSATWGGSVLVLDETDFTGPDTFSGLSSNGDQIELWDRDPNPNPAAANLVASVLFPAATAGFSFEWALDGSSLGLSVAGENGAFTAGTDVGSPGLTAVPEPSSLLAVALLGGVPLMRRRRA